MIYKFYENLIKIWYCKKNVSILVWESQFQQKLNKGKN